MSRFAALALAAALAAAAAGCGSTAESWRSTSPSVPGRDLTPAAGTTTATVPSDASEASATPDSSDAPQAHAGAGGGERPATAGTAARPSTGADTAVAPAAVTGPIQLGLLYAVNDGAQSAGIDNGNTFTVEQATKAFVASYNATGGIGGRRIVPVYAELHSASNDYESQVQTACATFTQDHHVAAVLSNVGYYSENLLACLTEASVPLISGDWAAPDRHDAARFPSYLTPATLLGDDRVVAVIDHLADARFLTSTSRVGVVVEACPIDQRIHQASVVPALRRAGLTLAATAEVPCFQSLGDYGGQASDVQGALLRFRQQRVDRVLVVSQAAEANIVFLLSQGAEAQQYHPGYALSSVAAPTVLALNAPAGQLANMRGVGWLPAVDTADRRQAPLTSTADRCLQRMKERGVRPASNADDATVAGLCDSFSLYDALLRATRGNASADAVMAAARTVGPGYVSASTVDGRVALWGNDRLGAARGRLFGFVGGRFQYTSAAFPL